MSGKPWTTILGGEAERDFVNILSWTTENFGVRQARAYAQLITAALDEIAEDPYSPRSRARGNDIGEGYRTLHVSRPGRHLVLYRPRQEREVLVVRILHDSMEVSRHMPPEN